MDKIIRTLLGKTGVDLPVLYFLTGKGFSFITMPITLYLVATLLSPVEQGFYFTFASLLSMSIFFELGLGMVICQFASHEYANLSWHPNGSLGGDADSLARVISLLRKSLKWYGLVAVLFAMLIVPSALWFMSGKPDSREVDFLIPWILLIAFFSFNTSLIPIFSVIEGSGKVADIQKMRLFQSLLGSVFTWLVLVNEGKLYSIVAEFFVYSILMVSWLLYFYRGLLRQIFFEKSCIGFASISWSKEILPMQWRISVSWVAVYFLSYFIIPLVFAFQGAVNAGKMGMSLKISTVVFTLSMAWVNTRTPFYGALIQKKEFEALDSLAMKSTVQALIAGFGFTVVIVAGLFLINKFTTAYEVRLLPAWVVGFMCLGSVAMVINSAIGGYLRAHKQEPLMFAMIMMAVISIAVCLVAAKYADLSTLAILYASVPIFVGIPSFGYILISKRKEWYGKT